MPDYIPRDAPSKLIWLTNFSNWLNTNGLTHGFTAPEITELSNASAEAATAIGVNETTPVTFAYRARYVGKNLKYGPYGDPVVCTVSV